MSNRSDSLAWMMGATVATRRILSFGDGDPVAEQVEAIGRKDSIVLPDPLMGPDLVFPVKSGAHVRTVFVQCKSGALGSLGKALWTLMPQLFQKKKRKEILIDKAKWPAFKMDPSVRMVFTDARLIEPAGRILLCGDGFSDGTITRVDERNKRLTAHPIVLVDTSFFRKHVQESLAVADARTKKTVTGNIVIVCQRVHRKQRTHQVPRATSEAAPAQMPTFEYRPRKIPLRQDFEQFDFLLRTDEVAADEPAPDAEVPDGGTATWDGDTQRDAQMKLTVPTQGPVLTIQPSQKQKSATPLEKKRTKRTKNMKQVKGQQNLHTYFPKREDSPSPKKQKQLY